RNPAGEVLSFEERAERSAKLVEIVVERAPAARREVFSRSHDGLARGILSRACADREKDLLARADLGLRALRGEEQRRALGRVRPEGRGREADDGEDARTLREPIAERRPRSRREFAVRQDDRDASARAQHPKATLDEEDVAFGTSYDLGELEA